MIFMFLNLKHEQEQKDENDSKCNEGKLKLFVLK